MLDRIAYLHDDDSKYTGMSTQMNVLRNILNKLGLPIRYTYLNFATTITGITYGSNQTVLDTTYVINDNFYDEDGTPFTCRKVLESILQPYGAFIMQNNGDYIVTDVHSLASNSMSSARR